MNFCHVLSDRLYGYLTEKIYLAPSSANFDDDETIGKIYDDIQYSQAIAFYNWKYPIRNVMTYTKSWEQYIFPSEEEFNYLKSGELNKIKDISVSIPIQAVQVVVKLEKQKTS